MKKGIKCAVLAAALAFGLCVWGGSAEAETLQVRGMAGMRMVSHPFVDEGAMDFDAINVGEYSAVGFFNVERVTIAGDMSIIGHGMGDASASVRFAGTPAVIEGNARLKSASLVVGYEGDVAQAGKTVTVQGNLYLEGSELENYSQGGEVTNSVIMVSGQNARLIVEGDLYCRGMCVINVESGGAIEVRGTIHPSAYTFVTVGDEPRNVQGGKGLKLVS